MSLGTLQTNRPRTEKLSHLGKLTFNFYNLICKMGIGMLTCSGMGFRNDVGMGMNEW